MPPLYRQVFSRQFLEAEFSEVRIDPVLFGRASYVQIEGLRGPTYIRLINTARTYYGPSRGRPSGPGLWSIPNFAGTAFSEVRIRDIKGLGPLYPSPPFTLFRKRQVAWAAWGSSTAAARRAGLARPSQAPSLAAPRHTRTLPCHPWKSHSPSGPPCSPLPQRSS